MVTLPLSTRSIQRFKRLVSKSTLEKHDRCGRCLLPDDIFLDIAHLLREAESLLTLATLASTCIHLHDILLPFLYSNFRFGNVQQLRTAMGLFRRNSSVVKHIKILTYEPLPNTLRQMLKCEETIALCVDELALHLRNLESFRWYGADMPAADSMWGSLQKGCIKLRNIRTSIDLSSENTQRLLYHTQLFDFKDLHSISLLCHRKFEPQTGIHTELGEISAFWDFLDASSSSLREISFHDGVHYTLNPLFNRSWPSLRKIHFDPHSFDKNTIAPDELAEFFNSHPSLNEVSLPIAYNLFNVPLCLPKVRRITGSTPITTVARQPVYTAYNKVERLRIVHSSERFPIYDDVMIKQICTSFQNLKSLRMTFRGLSSQFGLPYFILFVSLWQGVSSLETLDIYWATQKTCFPWKDLVSSPLIETLKEVNITMSVSPPTQASTLKQMLWQADDAFRVSKTLTRVTLNHRTRRSEIVGVYERVSRFPKVLTVQEFTSFTIPRTYRHNVSRRPTAEPAPKSEIY